MWGVVDRKAGGLADAQHICYKFREKDNFETNKTKRLQNAKDRKVGKGNAPVALQASIRANRASNDTQNVTMTGNR